MKLPSRSTLIGVATLAAAAPLSAGTVALWLFDEQEQLYPSSILNDAGPQDWFLVFGRGGALVPGKFGRALQPVEPAPFKPTFQRRVAHEEFSNASRYAFGLETPPRKPGRTVEPMTWFNAAFAAAFERAYKASALDDAARVDVLLTAGAALRRGNFAGLSGVWRVIRLGSFPCNG